MLSNAAQSCGPGKKLDHEELLYVKPMPVMQVKRSLVSLGFGVLQQAVGLLAAWLHAQVPALGTAVTWLDIAVDTPAARVIAEAQGVAIRQPVVFAAQFLWHGRNLALGLTFALSLPLVGLNSIVMLLRLPRPPWTAGRRCRL